MGMLSEEERSSLVSAETAAAATPVPTQVVSSDEFMPIAQTERQKKVEARMYKYEVKKAAWRHDRFAAIKADYRRRGPDTSNLRYGFVVPISAPKLHSTGV